MKNLSATFQSLTFSRGATRKLTNLAVTTFILAVFLAFQPDPALAEPLDEYSGWGGGIWAPMINTLSGLLTGLGSIGILVGLGLKATAASDQMRHAFSHRIMAGAATGLLVGLLATDIAGMFLQWVGL